MNRYAEIARVRLCRVWNRQWVACGCVEQREKMSSRFEVRTLEKVGQMRASAACSPTSHATAPARSFWLWTLRHCRDHRHSNIIAQRRGPMCCGHCDDDGHWKLLLLLPGTACTRRWKSMVQWQA